MKKASIRAKDDDLRPEYDLAKLKGGVRGKFVKRYQAGTNLRTLLRGPNREVALAQIESLTVPEKKELFPEWIHLARAAHSPFQRAWSVIESLPRDWVLQNIEGEVDAILQNEEETDYWMFLQLYARIDERLTTKLAHRAAGHTDAEIRALGKEYLSG